MFICFPFWIFHAKEKKFGEKKKKKNRDLGQLKKEFKKLK